MEERGEETRQVSFRDILADLRKPYVRHEFRTSWAIALFYRMPSPPFVWVLLRLGFGPMGVTALGFVLALTMPLQAAVLPLGLAAWALFISGVLFQILDCADGMMARLLGKASILGADLDYMSDMVQHGLFYTALGLLADRTLGTGFGWTALALAAAFVRLLARLVREQVALRVPEAGGDEPLRLKDLPIAFVAGLSGLIPFMALSGGYLGHMVAALLVYALLDVADAFLPMTKPPYRGDAE
ncbi:CDP-alcohol phosphatidyltransferase family protein [Shimia sp. FJ5]|uniref:CDP-alcohol phosphatidyltransferase family protein n=1 Tax=Shimia sp. FJ5 TaxID=3079054 RepID=UPI00260655AD|nr:CDP-alcohol phosphatidyltransferase family protein [Shimia sp. FJ5]MDV4146243.1 CDP-alcohol phosphatidyltransferase family protein [Shimia sp. FJ5]